jgi:NADH:ubiquinone oxidoreductase subunit D
MILDLFEEVSGARMMCNYMRFGGVVRDLTPGWEERAKYLVHDRLAARARPDGQDAHRQRNREGARAWRRLPCLPQDLIALSVSGPLIRAAGVPYDIRKAEPYCIYDRFDFDIPTLPESDIFRPLLHPSVGSARECQDSQAGAARHSQAEIMAKSWAARAATPSAQGRRSLPAH